MVPHCRSPVSSMTSTPPAWGAVGDVWPSTASRRRLTTSGAHCGAPWAQATPPRSVGNQRAGCVWQRARQRPARTLQAVLGWRYGLAVTHSSPRVGYGKSGLRAIAQEVLTHVNTLLVGWRCLCTPALGQYHTSPRPRTASLAHALAAPQQGRHVTLPALLVEEVRSVGLVSRGLHPPR